MIETGVEDIDRRKLFLKGRGDVRNYYYIPRVCPSCQGKGFRVGGRPNKNVPGKQFVRKIHCTPCKGYGHMPEWTPDSIRVFCTNSVCPRRYVADLDVRTIIQGFQITRSNSVDHINYSSSRYCPHCGFKIRPAYRVRFWRLAGDRWVDYFGGR